MLSQKCNVEIYFCLVDVIAKRVLCLENHLVSSVNGLVSQKVPNISVFGAERARSQINTFRTVGNMIMHEV
eukprot:COSAG05_NODE_12799_length_454_cov_0.763380_1_plen_70_part_10